MAARDQPKPVVMIDADVLFAAAASPSEHGASLLVLRLAELTLVDAVASEQVIVEAERNLAQKLPAVLPTFKLLTARCLRIVRDPAVAELHPFVGCAQPEDLPILVAAMQAQCQWLVTFNVRHYRPGIAAVRVLRPGDFVLRIRDLLAHLT